MRKLLATCLVAVMLFASSCATVFGGHVSECQKTKPAAGQPSRDVRVAALVFDILLFWPGVFIDMATGALYKPCGGR